MESNEELNRQAESGIIRDEQGRFVPGHTGNPEGRPILTPEQKAVKKALKELVADYKESLAQVLPQISPILVAKAIAGDMQAIKEIHSIVVGEAPKDITSGGEKIPTPLLYVLHNKFDGKDIPAS